MVQRKATVPAATETAKRELLRSYTDYIRWHDALQQAATPEAVDVAIHGMNQAQARIRQYRRELEVS